jgi:hypothetical protein
VNGLNTKFTENPEVFLRTVPIVESPELRDPLVFFKYPPKIYDLDLALDDQGAAKLGIANLTANPGEPVIKAYWLPWKSKAASEIELGDDANYFFTSQLGGCQMRVVRKTPGGKTKVLHIAGNVGKGTGGEGPEGTAWRAEQAQKALTRRGELGRSRAFSSTVPEPSGYKRAAELVNFVGFKGKFRVGKPEKEMIRWDFWAQKVDLDEHRNPVARVSRSWRFY